MFDGLDYLDEAFTCVSRHEACDDQPIMSNEKISLLRLKTAIEHEKDIEELSWLMHDVHVFLGCHQGYQGLNSKSSHHENFRSIASEYQAIVRDIMHDVFRPQRWTGFRDEMENFMRQMPAKLRTAHLGVDEDTRSQSNAVTIYKSASLKVLNSKPSDDSQKGADDCAEQASEPRAAPIPSAPVPDLREMEPLGTV